jgi:predicted amidohydrolase YtcJ
MFERAGLTLVLSLAIVVLGLVAPACGTRPQPADLVLRNGKIATVDPERPEVQALAVRGDSIAIVGGNADVERYIGPSTRVIDLAGKLAVPGLTDAHGHFMGVGESKLILDVLHVNNWGEVVTKVAEAAAKAQPGEWIVGRGWHQEKWNPKPSPNVEGFPADGGLSKAAPDNPVLLTHASGHATFANAKAMQLAGIRRGTPDPPGGRIVRDAAGNPIGVFEDEASGLVQRAMNEAQSRRTPAEREAEARKIIALAVQECLSKGITTFCDAGSSFQTIDLFKKVADEGGLGLRLWVMVREDNNSLAKKLPKYRLVDYGNRHLTVRAIKKLMDGALGSRSAWFLQPYQDLPTTSGLNTSPVEEVARAAQLALDNGYQLCVHAIGDRANRETLNIYEAAFKARPDAKNLRWRIEHAQHLAAADIPRFGALGIVAAMQGIHCTSDAPYVLARLGAQRADEGAYVWQKLMRTGAVIANGTDAPVEDVDPIACFHSTVSRRLKDGSVFYPDQRMSRTEALKSYTWNAAYAAFQEDSRGSLSPGKLADITILSKDILTIPEEEIPSTIVTHTIVGGKVLYERPSLD